MSKLIVDNYGLHQNKDDQIWWLLQQAGGENALGLPNKLCPVRIKSNLMMCPHNFDLSVSDSELKLELAQYEARLKYSPLLQFFDPATPPTHTGLYLETDKPSQFQTLMRLQELLSPSRSCAVSPAAPKEMFETIVKRLSASNLGTYLVYALNGSHLNTVRTLMTAMMTMRGRLILAGQSLPIQSVSGCLRQPYIDSSTEEFFEKLGPAKIRAIGALRLKKLMRQ